MGVAWIIIDFDKIDPLYDLEYIMDPKEKVIEEIENLGATEIKTGKFPDRIEFSYSEEKVMEDVKHYTSFRPFLIFKEEFIRMKKDIF